jgi:hypothetical protein
MAQTRFTCTVTKADEPASQSYARVTIVDAEETNARACPGTRGSSQRHYRRPR